MFKKILVATDGSRHAAKAVETASDLAARCNAELIVLHVLLHGQPLAEIRELAETEYDVQLPPAPPPPAGLSGTGAAMVDDSKAIQALYRAIVVIGDKIVEGATQVARDRGVKTVKPLVEDGDTVQRILNCAERETIDLVVMGSRGLGGLSGLLLGSNSHKVSQLAKCALLTVK
ncbi:MAG: universal stress protein [Rhodospirillales bacterium]|nr:universal stress protein [Rhodospirillales bacterium]MDH3914283.1 universal stress protein [Rhodospirillales bacterium]